MVVGKPHGRQLFLILTVETGPIDLLERSLYIYVLFLLLSRLYPNYSPAHKDYCCCHLS